MWTMLIYKEWIRWTCLGVRGRLKECSASKNILTYNIQLKCDWLLKLIIIITILDKRRYRRTSPQIFIVLLPPRFIVLFSNSKYYRVSNKCKWERERVIYIYDVRGFHNHKLATDKLTTAISQLTISQLTISQLTISQPTISQLTISQPTISQLTISQPITK